MVYKIQASFHKHFCKDGHNGTSDWSVKLIDQADDLTSLYVINEQKRLKKYYELYN